MSPNCHLFLLLQIMCTGLSTAADWCFAANRTGSRYQVFRGGAEALADLEAKDIAKKAAIIEEATRAQRAEEQRKKDRLERFAAEREQQITQRILQAGMPM